MVLVKLEPAHGSGIAVERDDAIPHEIVLGAMKPI
jgi:hypothetical protein